jgi:hypothetical protein
VQYLFVKITLSMTLFRSLFFLACVVPLLTSCAKEAPPEAARAKPSRQPEVKIGVFPEPVTTDSTQSLLEIQQWKFQVNIPRAHKHLLYILEVREKGKKPRTLNRAILGVAEGPQRRELTLSMLPLEFSWSKSAQIKQQFNLAGAVGTGEVENPFKACTSFSMGEAKALPDGSFLLMEGNRPGYSSVLGGGQGQVVLVLKLQSAAEVEALLAMG